MAAFRGGGRDDAREEDKAANPCGEVVLVFHDVDALIFMAATGWQGLVVRAHEH
jgi:hypothetical protein